MNLMSLMSLKYNILYLSRFSENDEFEIIEKRFLKKSWSFFTDPLKKLMKKRFSQDETTVFKGVAIG